MLEAVYTFLFYRNLTTKTIATIKKVAIITPLAESNKLRLIKIKNKSKFGKAQRLIKCVNIFSLKKKFRNSPGFASGYFNCQNINNEINGNSKPEIRPVSCELILVFCLFICAIN